MTVRTGCGWVKYREGGELLYGRRFPLKQKRTVYKSYVRTAILYRSETCRLKERCKFYEGQKDPCGEQCVEYS